MLIPRFKALITSICVIMIALIAWGCNTIPFGNNPSAGRYYNIRGIKMYCEVYGKGKPLLLIHGNGGSISTFKDIIPYLSGSYKTIIADSRSQGKSKDLKDSLSFEQMADDYAVLLDSLHVSSAYVFGWSDGGINALLLAMRHPEKVIRLVSSGANLWPDSTAIDPMVWKEDQKVYLELKDTKPEDPEKKNEFKMLLLDLKQPTIPLNALHQIKCPSLIMCGDHDIIRCEHTKLIFNNIPNANLWILPHSRHGTFFEHRWKVERMLNRFFTDTFAKEKVW